MTERTVLISDECPGDDTMTNQINSVDDIMREIRRRTHGRTRYEGQDPFCYWDEHLVGEIDRLRDAITRAIKYIDTTDGDIYCCMPLLLDVKAILTGEKPNDQPHPPTPHPP